MRIRTWLSLLSAGVSVLGSHCAIAETSANDQRVAQVFADFASGVQPGCAAGVVQGGKLVHSGAYGYSSIEDGRKLTTDSLFNIASMSKEFTAMAILLLEQRGKLSLEDSIRKHVPELGAYAEGITLRQVLHHVGGLGDGGELMGMRGNTEASRVDMKAWMHALSKLKSPQGPPGEHYEYSNTGYFLLAVTVERVSGVRFTKFLNDNIFAPLQMTHTFVPDEYPVKDPLRAPSQFS